MEQAHPEVHRPRFGAGSQPALARRGGPPHPGLRCARVDVCRDAIGAPQARQWPAKRRTRSKAACSKAAISPLSKCSRPSASLCSGLGATHGRLQHVVAFQRVHASYAADEPLIHRDMSSDALCSGERLHECRRFRRRPVLQKRSRSDPLSPSVRGGRAGGTPTTFMLRPALACDTYHKLKARCAEARPKTRPFGDGTIRAAAVNAWRRLGAL